MRRDLWEGKAARGAASTIRMLDRLPLEAFAGHVLDLGCNEGIVAEWLALHGAEVIGYEPHPVAFKRASARTRSPGEMPGVRPVFEVRQEAVLSTGGVATDGNVASAE